jgi:two-component sensor histidine kinase
MMCQLAHIPVRGQNPYIKHYTVNDGLPSNNVYQVFQDSRKFIWFATDAGAVRFDGINYKVYTTADGLPNSEIFRFEEDSRGRLWLFHLNGTFSYFFKEKLFTSLNEKFLDSLSNSMFFRRMYEDEKGSLYFYSNLNREVFILDTENHVKKHRFPHVRVKCSGKEKMQDAFMLAGLYKYKGAMWLFNQNGIYWIESIDDTLVAYDNTFHAERAFMQKNGSMFIDAVIKELGQYRLLKFNGLKVVDSLHFEARRPHEIITDVFEDSNQNIWLSSYYSGIYVYKDNVLLQRFDLPKTQNIIEDHQGNIWIATLGSGVYRFHPAVLQNKHYGAEQFSGQGLKALAERKAGGIWMSEGDYLYLLSDNSIKRSKNPLSEGDITGIGEFENGSILLHTPEMALQVFQVISQSKEIIQMQRVSQIDHPIKSFVIAPDNKSAAAFYPFRLYRFDQNNLKNYIELEFPERFTAAFYNQQGQLHIAGKNIYQFKDNSLVPDESLQKFVSETVRQHLILSEGIELFNISGDSLWLYQNEKIFSLTASFEHNLPMQIKSMSFDGTSTLFMASSSHIYWSPNPLDAIIGKKVQLFSLNIHFNNIQQIEIINDTLYIASEEGLSCISTKTLTSQTTKKPLAYFREILVNDSPVDFGQKQSIVRGKNSFSFSLGSIHFSPEQERYAYRLETRDTNWIMQKAGNIVYQDLRPGKYTFRFKTKLPTSDWSDELQHFIIVKPTLIQHPVFFVMLVSITVALLITFILRRKNKLHQEQETAHQMVLLEQKALQSMMNPHFIFNALGSIQSYILKNNSADAGLYLSQFARLIRQNLNAIKTSMIPLDEEVDRLRNYLDLERLRMNNRFSFIIDIGEEIEEDVLIPTMILQPIVENAIWHGLATLEENGLINIFFTKFTDKTMRIVIEDNGIGTEQAALQTKRKDTHLQIGMNLTLKRLELIGKKLNVKTSITTSDIHPGNPYPGTKVEIIVPYVFEAAEFEENK